MTHLVIKGDLGWLFPQQPRFSTLAYIFETTEESVMKIIRSLSFAGLFILVSVVLAGCNGDTGLSESAIKEKEKKEDIKNRLLVKAEEYANLSYPVKEEKTPTVKGKVTIVSNIHGQVGKYEWRGYEIQGYKSWSGAEDASYTELYGFNQGDLAISPEEMKTLIQIKCAKGKELGTIGERGISYSQPYYSSVCKVSVIDIDAQKVIAGKTFENAAPQKTTSNVAKPEKPNTDCILKPSDEIKDYLLKMKKAP